MPNERNLDCCWEFNDDRNWSKLPSESYKTKLSSPTISRVVPLSIWWTLIWWTLVTETFTRRRFQVEILLTPIGFATKFIIWPISLSISPSPWDGKRTMEIILRQKLGSTCGRAYCFRNFRTSHVGVAIDELRKNVWMLTHQQISTLKLFSRFDWVKQFGFKNSLANADVC